MYKMEANDGKLPDSGRGRDRWLWPTLSVALAAVVLLLALSPRVLALTRDQEAQRLATVFAEVFQYIRTNYVDEERADPEALIRGALDGMFDALGDPYSAYIPADEMGDLNDLTVGEFGGVGLLISAGDAGVEVVAPIDGHPAYQAGVQPGDVIIEVDSAPAADLTVNEMMQLLRGEPGTEVAVTFLRGEAIRLEVVIERALIEVPTVKSAAIPQLEGPAIGYLRITQFTRRTPARVADALEQLEHDGYGSLVVDLRSNPGGLLSAVVNVANYFLDSGSIVSTRSRVRSENQVHYASRRTTVVPREMPVVVLVDRGSASASEIFAGAMRDTGRGYVIGEPTYGKGSVQQVRHFGDDAVKVTTSRYFTPSGASIESVGVIPDLEIGLPELSDEEQTAVADLFASGRIRRFARESVSATGGSPPSKATLSAFLDELATEDLGLERDYLHRLIVEQMRRSLPAPPVYDLENDVVLQEAVRLLNDGAINAPRAGAGVRLSRPDEPVVSDLQPAR
jgi:carboxyl-terminal processing protease